MSNSKKRQKLIVLDDRERACCWIYLILDLFFLPGILSYANRLLPYPLPNVWLNFLYFSLNFGIILGLCHGYLHKSLVHAGKHPGEFLQAAVVGFLLYYAASLIMSWLLNRLAPGFSNVNDGTIGTMAKNSFWPMAIGTVLLVPTAEEVLYRGLLFGSFYGKHPRRAYLFSTLVFSAIHVMGYLGKYDALTLALCFLQYIPAGLCLAWAYAESGTIFAPILIHTVINAMGIYAVR